jgi:EAL domain-containing protein (putative c-di-GMP-specific phosphodiesterase class I)/GGDEF domain-containing protein
MFTSLRSRLTVLYAGLFGVALLVTALAVYASVSANARVQVERQLTSGGAVFDRVWALKASQLTDSATVLSRDFGFRAAVATHDVPTVESALENLRGRLKIDRAILVGADGTITGATGLTEAAASDLWYALDGGATSGVLTIAGKPHQAVAAPVMAPQLTGWVVFAERLDQPELTALERLSSIPLSASVLVHAGDAGWMGPGATDRDLAPMSAMVDSALTSLSTRPHAFRGDAGKAIALVKPLATFGKERAVLVLRYPLSRAMAPYQSLMLILALTGLAGLAVLAAGSWLLARSITRPVSALDAAAHRLQRGEEALVEVATNDEIGRLATSFNAMAAGIRDREGRITRMALTDQETGLANRLALEQALAGSADPALWVAVLSVDRFPQVRAAVGYQLAGEMLRELGERVATLRPGTICARISSERLALSLTAPDGAAATRAVEALLDGLTLPVQAGGVTIDIGLTAGLAPVVDDHSAPPVERASAALDQARASQRRATLFDADAYGDPASKLSLMSEMLEGLEDGSITLHYQAKHDIRAGAVTAAEALIRWTHPTRGFIRPDLFVELAEETGHIRAMTRWTLTRAIADQAALRAAGRDMQISVNLSGRLVADEEFAEEIIALVSGADCNLCLEITETAVIGNPTLALQIIDRYRAAGLSVSIDDYGSGLSSLAYLKQIHADELKIDKAFVLSLGPTSRDALLVRSTIDLAHSLGLKVVAEGVETAEALAVLSSMGCDMAQGYFIARPMPLADLITFLEAATEPKPARRKA